MITLEDLKKKEYSESFDELKLKAEAIARIQKEDALDILSNWIWSDFCHGVATRKGRNTSNVNPEEKTENRRDKMKIVIRKMKPSPTQPGSDVEKDLVTSKQVSNPCLARNDHQMNRKREGRMTCKEKRASPSSAWNCHVKRKREITEDEDEKEKRKRMIKNALNSENCFTPDLPMEVRNKIEELHGSKPELVIQKVIQKTDLSDHHDRLNIPKGQVSNMNVLTDEERLELDRTNSLEVRIIQPCLDDQYDLRLRKWSTKQIDGFNYVLNSSWKRIYSEHRNGLEEGRMLQIWSFRVGDDPGVIWFALVTFDAEIILGTSIQ